MDDNDVVLTDSQRRLAESDARFIRVLAGPGTGKTFGLKHRVRRLLELGVDPKRVLAVTFTRAAAASLRNDLNSEGFDAIEARTLHSLCFSVLQRQQTLQTTGRHPRPLLDFERNPLLADIPNSIAGKKYGKKAKEDAIRAFEAAWAQLQSDEPGWPKVEHEREFQGHLIDWLLFHKAMLIGEVVPTMLEYLRNNPENKPRYDHIIVDEFQDLNKAEQSLIDYLSEGGNQVVLGDDNQSIYSFKYAHPEGIIEYPRYHPETQDILTNMCRRCPPTVVDMANALVQNQSKGEAGRNLICSDPERAEDIAIVRWRNEREEARGVAHFLREYLKKNREIGLGDVLVLAPRRQFAYRIREELAQNSLPSKSYYDEELDAVSAQRSLTLLRLLVDPKDRVAIRWLIGTPTPLPATYRVIREYCEENNAELKDVLDSIEQREIKFPRDRAILSRWRDAKLDLSRHENLTGYNLIESLMPEKEESVASLRSLALEYVQEDSDPEAILGSLLNALRGPEVPRESESIRIMSAHKSKGLTAEVVVVVGLIEGIFPFTRPEESPVEAKRKIAEGRRLLYVAMTRTRRALLLSSASSMSLGLAKQMGVPRISGFRGYTRLTASSFLKEMASVAPRPVSPEQLWQQFGFPTPD